MHGEFPKHTYSDSLSNVHAGVAVREIARTPSPTPSEAHVLSEKSRVCDWRVLVYPRLLFTLRGLSASSFSASREVGQNY